MGRAIEYFMWGFQPHFRCSAGTNASFLFNLLDERLAPEVFLVGILADDDRQNHPSCVEPEEDFWIHSSSFTNVLQDSTKLIPNYPDADLNHSDLNAGMLHIERMRKRAVRDSILHVIDNNPQKPNSMTYRASFPVRVGPYWIVVILGLQDSIVQEHYSLTNSEGTIGLRPIRLAVSLIDAAAEQFLAECEDELLKPEPGADLFRMNTEEVLRSAGQRLAQDTVARVDNTKVSGLHNFYRSCTSVASLKYEGTESSGGLILSKSDENSINKVIEFIDPVLMREFRTVRKLLELSSDESLLMCDSELVTGIAKLVQDSPGEESVFSVRFIGNNCWELIHKDETMMCVRFGIPSLPKKEFDEDKLRTDLPRIFSEITQPDIEILLELIRAAATEPHGTLLVITEDAESESARLRSQCTRIAPQKLDIELIRRITPIDGAVVLNPQGYCFAIGVILDGMATEAGDPGRGARYNSALRYERTAGKGCLVVVVSEDGGVDIIPDLMPAIARSTIDNHISSIVALAEDENPSRTEFNRRYNFLREHSLYLREEDCDVLNPVVQTITNKLRGDATIWITYPEFRPNESLDEALHYLDGAD